MTKRGRPARTDKVSAAEKQKAYRSRRFSASSARSDDARKVSGDEAQSRRKADAARRALQGAEKPDEPTETREPASAGRRSARRGRTAEGPAAAATPASTSDYSGTRCPECGALLALVGRMHRCVPVRAR
jgi:hypothetical protein